MPPVIAEICHPLGGCERDSETEVATQSDPTLSATLLLTLHRIKTALAATVLEGATVDPTPPPLSLPKREKIFGEGGIMQQLLSTPGGGGVVDG